MKKKYITLALAAAFALFTLASCGSKGKSSKEKDDDDTEEVEEDEQEKEEQEETGKYLSQDWATFDLYGRVLSVSYDRGEHSVPVSIQFDEDGNLVSIISHSGGEAETASINRDENGRIGLVSFESDDPWVYTFSYKGEGFVPPSVFMNSNQMGNFMAENYYRDADGKLIEMKYEEFIHGYEVEGQPEHVITLFDYDSHGNWQKCTDTSGEDVSIIRRSIAYHDGTVNATGDASRDIAEEAKGFITRMYENHLYMEEDFLFKHCTPEMMQFLREQYEYDGEGLATWLFRTSAQDGKPGADGVKDKVLAVKEIGDGWYSYQFTDEGWKGENRIKLNYNGGRFWIDGLERVYDEPSIGL